MKRPPMRTKPHKGPLRGDVLIVHEKYEDYKKWA